MDKKQLSESDICDKFIRSAVAQVGWTKLDQTYREFLLRAGRVSVRGNKAHRDQSTVLRADTPCFTKPTSGPRRSNVVPHISTKQVGALFGCSPPITEQYRIVTRVNELRSLCADLRTALKTAASVAEKVSIGLIA